MCPAVFSMEIMSLNKKITFFYWMVQIKDTVSIFNKLYDTCDVISHIGPQSLGVIN